MEPLATFRTRCAREGTHKKNDFQKNEHKKIAAPAPDLFDPGRRASLLCWRGRAYMCSTSHKAVKIDFKAFYSLTGL